MDYRGKDKAVGSYPSRNVSETRKFFGRRSNLVIGSPAVPGNDEGNKIRLYQSPWGTRCAQGAIQLLEGFDFNAGGRLNR